MGVIGRFEHDVVSRARCSAQLLRSAASQNRDPVSSSFFVGWAKARLRRAHHLSTNTAFACYGGHGAKTRLCPPYRSALRFVRGYDGRSRNCESIPIPAFRTSLILLVSCPMRGASRGVTEVGQSESLIGAG